MIAFSSNAVNLTDGLDGLAIGCTIIAAGALTVLTYVSGHAVFADYLDLQRMPQVGELAIFCGTMVGASIGFLWYNAHPAEVFMGDVGSLALGGAIGTVAVIIKQEMLLPFIGGVFVIEALSVILQVGVLQAAQEAYLQDGSSASPFRVAGLVGIEGDRPFLDRFAGLRPVRADDPEIKIEQKQFPFPVSRFQRLEAYAFRLSGNWKPETGNFLLVFAIPRLYRFVTRDKMRTHG